MRKPRKLTAAERRIERQGYRRGCDEWRGKAEAAEERFKTERARCSELSRDMVRMRAELDDDFTVVVRSAEVRMRDLFEDRHSRATDYIRHLEAVERNEPTALSAWERICGPGGADETDITLNGGG